MDKHSEDIPLDDELNTRPSIAIARRSCDPCRTRKIRCDRKSPCSNCTAARLRCVHSQVASGSSAPSPKQRVLISAQYEQKIDDIVKSINGIELLLQKTRPAQRDEVHVKPMALVADREDLLKLVKEPWLGDDSQRDRDSSNYMFDFVRRVVDSSEARVLSQSEARDVEQLKNFLRNADNAELPGKQRAKGARKAAESTQWQLPPLADAVAVLRWDKATQTKSVESNWLLRLLPQEKYHDLCQKVYFAVDDYDEAEFILACGYLAYTFAEYGFTTGREEYQANCNICWESLLAAITRIPVHLWASVEVVAALALGAFYAVEHSKTTLAWNLISAAMGHAQTLNLHRQGQADNRDPLLRFSHETLFWTIYRLERGLALRLGRVSRIRDIDISVEPTSYNIRSSMIGQLEGQVYDQLYSPRALSSGDTERRAAVAHAIAKVLKRDIAQLEVELNQVVRASNGAQTIPGSAIQIQCDLICQSAKLTLVLRAVPSAQGQFSSVPDDCIQMARNVLRIHEQFMTSIRNTGNHRFMVAKYINWGIVHVPFVPFHILFKRVITILDLNDLALLEHFASSLQSAIDVSGSENHPCQLYPLLCQAARLHVSQQVDFIESNPTLSNAFSGSFEGLDFPPFDGSLGGKSDDDIVSGEYPASELSMWYHENQQLTEFFDGGIGI